MIHTFTITTHQPDLSGLDRYIAHCDTCGDRLHEPPGIPQRDLAVLDAKQHARIAHGAKDVVGNDIAWERIPEDDQVENDQSKRPGRWVRHPELESAYARSVGATVELFEEE